MDPERRILKAGYTTLIASLAVVALLLLPGRAVAQTYDTGLVSTGPTTAQIWFGNYGPVGSFADTFTFSVGSSFNFSFTDLANSNIGSPGSYGITPLTASLLDGSMLPVVGIGSIASGPSLLNTTPVVGLAAGIYNIQVAGLATPGGNYWGSATLTNLPAAPVPEPETYAMMLAGLGLMGFVARRRRQKEAA